MMRTKSVQLLLSLFILLSFTHCLSLAEDVTPPPGFSVPSSDIERELNPTPPIEEIASSIAPPDPNNGAIIYAENCLPCHGENGMGDGPDAALIENSVPALGNIALSRTASPLQWYTIVTEGNLPAFMPPFNSLSDQERWNVVAYLFTLSAPLEVVQQGQHLFIENCAECHGEDGSEGVVDLTDLVFMSQLPSQQILTAISAGHELMPSFEAMEESKQWAITSFLRQASFVPYTPQIEMELAVGTVQTSEDKDLSILDVENEPGFTSAAVTVINNSDESLPTDLEVVLRGYDDMAAAYTQTLTLLAGYAVQFENVPLKIGRMYFATIEHKNAAYGSNVISIEGEDSSLSLEIPYYAPTTDLAVLNVDRIHLFIDFVDEATLEIFQLYIFSNPSNQVLVPRESGGTVVDFVIPATASNLYVEDNMRMAYRKTEDGFGITNIYPDVDPYQAVFSYQVPYDGKKTDLAVPIAMDANALILLAPADGFKVNSNQLQSAGTRQFEGVSYNMFTGGGMPTETSLNLTLSGMPKTRTNFLASTEDTVVNLAIGIGGFGIALLAAGIFLWRRNHAEEVGFSNGEDEATISGKSAEDLMDAIIALDDQFRSGSLPEEAYQRRRAELKERLRGIVQLQ
jgi:mono/diheme cytochrome c family protein